MHRAACIDETHYVLALALRERERGVDVAKHRVEHAVIQRAEERIAQCDGVALRESELPLLAHARLQR